MTNITRRQQKLFAALCYVTLFAEVYREIVGDPTLLFVGGFNLTTAEPCIIFGILCSFAWMKTERPSLNVIRLCSLIIFSCLVINFFRGILTNPYAALFALRSTGVITIFFWLCFRIELDEKAFRSACKAIVISSIILSMLVFVRTIAGPATFMLRLSVEAFDINDGGRAVTAQGAVMIGIGAITLTDWWLRRRGPAWGSTPTIVFVIAGLLLTRQGTAVLASITGLFTLLTLDTGRAQNLRRYLFGTVLIVTAIITFLNVSFLSSGTLQSVLPSAVVGDVTQRLNNLNTRQAVWDGLLQSYNGWNIFQKMFGLPAGTKPEIFVNLWNGIYWENSIHSMYYGLLPIAGGIGLLSYCLFVIVSLISNLSRALVRRSELMSNSALSAAFVVVCVVMGYSYELRNEVALALLIVVASPYGALLRRRGSVVGLRARGLHRGVSLDVSRFNIGASQRGL